MEYKVKDFDYNLPLELIAQEPAKPRDHSRLLLLDKGTGAISHKYFYDLVNYLKKGDLLVLNNSRVFPARLKGRKSGTGGSVEIFLHKKLTINDLPTRTRGNIWECLIGGRVKEELIIELMNGYKTTGLRGQILKNNEDGTWQVRFNMEGNKFWETINKIGFVPLPPYIKRNEKLKSDKNNYQTVYADSRQIGSAAAPTAGLHFTNRLLDKIKAKGVKIAYVTLHVGLGTFAPVKSEEISGHKMHSEFAIVESKTIKAVLRTKQMGGRVIAIGTTSCRTLESVDWDKAEAQSFWTDIFIYPGYRFKVVDALVTNFHLPKSTLLMLVSALVGKKYIDSAYLEAVSKGYHFFSYGDAMFIY